MTNNQQITYTNELQRKGIHITSMLIPIIYYFIDRPTALSILIPLTCITLIIDLFIHYNPTFRSFSHGMIGHLMRPHELNRTSLVLNGASWVMIAAVLTVFVFPKTIAIIAFSIVILCDMFAALIGRKIGKTKFIEELYKDYIVDEYEKKYKFKLYAGRVGDEINTKHLIIKNY